MASTNIRILLVTERCHKHQLPLVLSQAGYDVIEPRVPSEAPKVVQTEQIDLVVLAHCLAAKRRETLAHLIRAYRPDIPIICVTENLVTDVPTVGSALLTSCHTMLWAIDHAMPRETKKDPLIAITPAEGVRADAGKAKRRK